MTEPSEDKTLPGPCTDPLPVDRAYGHALTIGRYLVHERIASSGMAAIHLGTSTGVAGFARRVAVKRLLPELNTDPQMVAMFIDEARIGAAIRHTNVVATIDLVRDRQELFLVMEHVDGASLLALLRASQLRSERVPRGVAVAIIVDLLRGLHAAHTAVDTEGAPLDIVHRDVSPSNVLVGADGTTRIIDFGIAAARGRLHQTRAHETGIKGKLAYLAPEQVLGEKACPRTDIYAAGVVLWELVTGQRLFHGDGDRDVCEKILAGAIPMPSTLHNALSPFDDVVRHAVALDRTHRFPNALEMARAVERCGVAASRDHVAAWLAYLTTDSPPPALRDASVRISMHDARARPSVVVPEPLVEALRGLRASTLVARDHAETVLALLTDTATRILREVRPRISASVVAVLVLMAVACASLVAAIATPAGH